MHLTDLSSPEADGEPSFSSDGRTLYFASERPSGVGARDLWYTTRSCE